MSNENNTQAVDEKELNAEFEAKLREVEAYKESGAQGAANRKAVADVKDARKSHRDWFRDLFNEADNAKVIMGVLADATINGVVDPRKAGPAIEAAALEMDANATYDAEFFANEKPDAKRDEVITKHTHTVMKNIARAGTLWVDKNTKPSKHDKQEAFEATFKKRGVGLTVGSATQTLESAMRDVAAALMFG